jgi:membrane fusion protein (multidrug efflux system)
VPKSSRKSFFWRSILLLAVIALVALATYELLHSYRHVYEPNARVEADFSILSSSVNGNIASIHALEGSLVQAGEKLASMDSDVAALDARTLEAELEREQAVREQVEAELKFFLYELDGEIHTARESVALLRAERATMLERKAIAQGNVDRNTKLLGKSAISQQLIDDAQDKLLGITSTIRSLQTEIAVSESKLQELLGRKRRQGVYQSRLEVIDRNLAKFRVQLVQSRQRLLDMHIYSPIRGIVNEIYVRPGAYVEDGTQVFLLHDPDKLWVEADINESDIRHVRVGQQVDVELDAYPFEHFPGTVKSIGHVTVSNIAHEKMARNGVRGVQKIPVIIDFPGIGKPVWPGMRAAVNIVIR